MLASPEQIVAGIDRLIEKERSRLRGDPKEDLRALYDRLEAFARRRAAYQDQQAAGYMTLEELGAKLEELEEAREAVERGLEACKNRGSRIAELEEARDLFSFRGAFWEELEELDEWTTVDGPHGEYRVRVPVEEWKKSYRRMSREASFDALKKFTPEQRREKYRELELKVTALSKEELSVSGVFDTERLYISEPSPTPSTRP